MMAKLRAVFYARVSTKIEEQLNAIELQIEENRNVIRNNGWELVDEYIDRGITGTVAGKRDDYQRLYEDLESGKFDIVVCKEQDRLQRNTLDWYLFLNRLVANDLKLYIYLDHKFYTPDNALLTGIKAILAEEESRKTSKKLNNYYQSRREMILAGDYSQIPAPKVFGYKMGKVDGKIIIEENEAEIVREIYKLYIAGNGIRSITRILEERGVEVNGKPVSESTIKNIVRNPRYKGTYVEYPYHYDFEKKKRVKSDAECIEVANCIPKIVTEEIWEQARQIREGRKSTYNTDTGLVSRGLNAGTYLFSSKIYCGECGSKFWRRGKDTGYNERIGYKCSRRIAKGSKACNCRRVLESDLLEICEEITKEFSENRDNIRADLERFLKELVKRLSNGASIKELREKETKIKKREEVLLDNLLDGTISKEVYSRKSKELEAELEQIAERGRQAQKTSSDLRDAEKYLKNIDAELDKMMYSDEFTEAKYKFIIEHIQKIMVYEDRIVVSMDVTQKSFVKMLSVPSKMPGRKTWNCR